MQICCNTSEKLSLQIHQITKRKAAAGNTMAPAVIQTQPSSSVKISKPVSPVVDGLLSNVDQVKFLLLLNISPDLDYDPTPAPTFLPATNHCFYSYYGSYIFSIFYVFLASSPFPIAIAGNLSLTTTPTYAKENSSCYKSLLLLLLLILTMLLLTCSYFCSLP